MKKKEKEKRVFEVDEDEYYILKRAVDFLTSSMLDNSRELYDLDSRLASTKFENLTQVLKQ
jgi:hypothetical protein